MSIHKKLLEVQKEIQPIVKDSTNPHFKNKYFDINTLLADIKPILNKHGLVLMQPLTHEDGRAHLKTILVNTESDDGGMISHSVPLPEVSDPQKMGSAITYYRRYSLQALLALEAEDDDGNHASGNSKPAQATTAPYKAPATPTKVESFDPTSLNWTEVEIGFGKNKGTKLGQLPESSLKWYAQEWTPTGANDGIVKAAAVYGYAAKSGKFDGLPPTDMENEPPF